jgi:predicted nucleic acid-binding protein
VTCRGPIAWLATRAQVVALERDVFARFARVNRCVGPSVAAWTDCGRVLVELWRRDGIPFTDRPRSLVNDILLATSCRELGMTLVTTDRDVAAIAPYVRGFQYAAAWP